jgi:hypothetical protein
LPTRALSGKTECYRIMQGKGERVRSQANPIRHSLCRAPLGPFSPGERRSGRGGSYQATSLATFHPLPCPLPSRERAKDTGQPQFVPNTIEPSHTSHKGDSAKPPSFWFMGTTPFTAWYSPFMYYAAVAITPTTASRFPEAGSGREPGVTSKGPGRSNSFAISRMAGKTSCPSSRRQVLRSSNVIGP